LAPDKANIGRSFLGSAQLLPQLRLERLGTVAGETATLLDVSIEARTLVDAAASVIDDAIERF
jgi:hypothetical protein